MTVSFYYRMRRTEPNQGLLFPILGAGCWNHGWWISSSEWFGRSNPLKRPQSVLLIGTDQNASHSAFFGERNNQITGDFNVPTWSEVDLWFVWISKNHDSWWTKWSNHSEIGFILQQSFHRRYSRTDFVSLLLDFSNKRAHHVTSDWQNFGALCVVFPQPRGFKPTEASSKLFCFTRNLP